MRFIQPINYLHTHTHTGWVIGGQAYLLATVCMDRSITLQQSFTSSLSLSFPCQLNLLSSLPFQLSHLSLSSSSLTSSLFPSLFLIPSGCLRATFFSPSHSPLSSVSPSLPRSFRLIAACSVHKREVFHLRKIYMGV